MCKAWLLGKEKNRMGRSYIWNTLASFLNALQSTIILFVIQRVATESASGMFSIAFATANLVLAIGKFGTRYYQVSDISEKYSYEGYMSHRILTSALMIVATLIFCAVSLFSGNYSGEKALFCLLLCLQKVVDAVEDAVHGQYHKQGRLDVAGKAMFIRLFCTVASFIVGFVFTKSLVLAAALSFAVSCAVFVVLTSLIGWGVDKQRLGADRRQALSIMVACAPLFATSFLSLFITNAPKYAIDLYMSEEIQAIYGFVSLPALVVALLADCLFRPIVTSFAKSWQENKIRDFCRRIALVMAGIMGLGAVCVIGGVVVGVPVLSIFFKYDLTPYRLPLGIILFGGGLLSAVSFTNIILTVIDRARSIAVFHLVAAALSIPVTYLFVTRMELLGASLSYLCVVSVLCVTELLGLAFFIAKRRGELYEQSK